jgi:hypothetical protein
LSDFLDSFVRYVSIAMGAVDNAAIMLALVLTTAIMAAVGGMMGEKMRIYGALAGGMLVNVVIKAMGGGYAAALAAMLVTAGVGYALGCAPLLMKLLRLQQRRP